MKNQLIKERIGGIDYLRILACFLVVLYHVPLSANYDSIEFRDFASHGIYVSCFYIGRLAVPLFFIISGFLLFPAKEDLLPFIKRRFGRVFFPTCLWFIIFYFWGIPLDEGTLHLPYIQRCQHLWYMFALFGAYLTIPIISPWFNTASNKSILFVLGLWTVTLFFPIINTFTPLKLQFSHQGMLYSTPFHSLLSFSGYMGYVFVGGCIKKYLDFINERKFLISLVLFIIAVIVYFSSIFFKVPSEDAYAYLSIPTAFISVTVFVFFVTCFDEKTNKHITDISNLTFGVYLLHPLILEQIHIETLGGYSRLLIAFLSFLVSLLIIKGLSFVPHGKYLIG